MTAVAYEDEAPTLGNVAAAEDSGDSIRTRRERLGMSVRALAKEAGVDRSRISLVEEGGEISSTVRRAIVAALDRLEDEVSGPYDESRDVVTFRLKGNFGVDVTLQGPVSNIDDLEASVTRLIKSMGDPSARPSHPDDV